MTRWIALLAGPLLWALHFTIAYVAASLSIQLSGGVTLAARAVVAGSAAILAVAAIVLALNRPHAEFRSAVRAAGCVLAAIAIAWQTLPLLLN